METALRQRITELQKYRQAGLRWLRSAKLYDKMTTTHEAAQPHLLDDVLHYIQVCECLLCYCFRTVFLCKWQYKSKLLTVPRIREFVYCLLLSEVIMLVTSVTLIRAFIV